MVAPFPTRGEKPWDAKLKAYLDTNHASKTVETAIARAIPAAAGAVGQHVTIGPAGPTWIDTTEYTVKHPRFAGGATGVPGQNQTAAIQAAIDLAGATTSGSTTQGMIVRFPDGIYEAPDGLAVTKQGVTFKGAGRMATWLRTSSADLVTLTGASKFRAESMRFQSQPGGGHIFKIADSLSYAIWTEVMCSQQNDGKSILYGDDGGAATLNYIDNTWWHCDTDHKETATVASFHLRGGAINRNYWGKSRHTYTGNYAFLIETTAAGSYDNDNTIDGYNMEVCTGGIVKALGAQGIVLRDIAIYDLLRNSTRDLIVIDSSGTGLPSRQIMLDNVRRNGFSLGAGLYDVVLNGTSLGRVTMMNCGGSTTLRVNANNKRYVAIQSNLTLTNGDAGLVISADSAGSSFFDAVAFKSPIKLASYTTAGRPSAATAGAGAVVWNTSTNKPNYSDGTNWRDAAGTVV